MSRRLGLEERGRSCQVITAEWCVGSDDGGDAEPTWQTPNVLWGSAGESLSE